MERCFEIEKAYKVPLAIKLGLYLYFVISVFEPYINGLVGSITKYLILILCGIILKYTGKIKTYKISMMYIMWFLLKVISLLWSEDYTTPLLHFTSQIGMVMLLVSILSVNIDKSTIDNIYKCLCFPSGLLGVLSFFFSASYHDTIQNRQVVSLWGVELDPNNLAAFLLIGFAISFYYLLNDFKKITKKQIILYGFIIFANFFACLKTGSRAGLVSTLLVTLAIVGFSYRNILFSIKKTVLLILGFGFAVYLINNYLPAEIYYRLFVNEYGDGSMRSFMWLNVWERYTSNIFTILFGIGWGTATISTNEVVAVHNTFLTLLCDVGLIGVFLFLFRKRQNNARIPKAIIISYNSRVG